MKGCALLQTRDRLSIPMHQVDAHNVVPVWEASDKKETAARTIRKKIHTKLPTYLTVLMNSLLSFGIIHLWEEVHLLLICLLMSCTNCPSARPMCHSVYVA